MEKSYYLADANLVDQFLGAGPTVEVTEHSKKFHGRGTLHRNVKVHRIDECSIEVSMRGYDGSRFKFMFNPVTKRGRLVEPCFEGSSEEELLLRQLWRSTGETLRLPLS